VGLRLDGRVPFADGRFPTPSGRLEIRSAALEAEGLDPLPGWVPDEDAAPPPAGYDRSAAVRLVTPAAHHFVTSTFANGEALERLEGAPFIELNPADARRRGIVDGDWVLVENSRGSCRLRARITDAVAAGVAASPKGYWSRRQGPPNGGPPTNVNWTTGDVLADFGGQSTFHTNDVWIRRIDS
jgi:anaerobic selenocysteine-containing dehydrogenase